MRRGASLRNPAEHAVLAAQVQTALAAWASRPRITRPAGPDIEQLAAQLAQAEQQLTGPSTARWLLFLLAGIVAATLSFRFVGLELLALVLVILAASGVAWRQRRTRVDALIRERKARIQSEVERRREDDRRYDEDVTKHDQAEEGLHLAADRCGIAEGETGRRAMLLERWLADWRREMEANAVQQRRLNEAQRKADDAMQSYARTRGELDQFARDMPDVSAAEEAEQTARLAHDRLERLDSTLRRTIKFLGRAEERVHRDIAPRLRASVCKHLSRITGGRYTDCRIDPQSLSVEVRSGNGPWRRAEWLSHGASDQIYLLLRMALAEHLSAPDETCPLILDDPIATSDAERRKAVLDTLLAISESTQVILFTHDRDTRDWARKRLSEPRGRLRELDRAGVLA